MGGSADGCPTLRCPDAHGAAVAAHLVATALPENSNGHLHGGDDPGLQHGLPPSGPVHGDGLGAGGPARGDLVDDPGLHCHAGPRTAGDRLDGVARRHPRRQGGPWRDSRRPRPRCRQCRQRGAVAVLRRSLLPLARLPSRPDDQAGPLRSGGGRPASGRCRRDDLPVLRGRLAPGADEAVARDRPCRCLAPLGDDRGGLGGCGHRGIPAGPSDAHRQPTRFHAVRAGGHPTGPGPLLGSDRRRRHRLRAQGSLLRGEQQGLLCQGRHQSTRRLEGCRADRGPGGRHRR